MKKMKISSRRRGGEEGKEEASEGGKIKVIKEKKENTRASVMKGGIWENV